MMGPTPGIVISRAVSSSSLALVRIFRSSLSIFSSSLFDPLEQQPSQLDDRLRQATVPVLENRGQLPDPGPALSEQPRRTRAR